MQILTAALQICLSMHVLLQGIHFQDLTLLCHADSCLKFALNIITNKEQWWKINVLGFYACVLEVDVDGGIMFLKMTS